MHISLDWLRQYVPVAASAEEVADRITQSGFEIDSITAVPGPAPDAPDACLDVEVTWNRPDCQSHVGLAREVAGLLGASLQVPRPRPETVPDPVDVAIEAPEMCPVYTARIVRGVRVGPSPDWMVRRLEAVGLRSVNNVVDVTNYVLMETGQPLHAFDLAKLRGPRLVARRAPGESMTAIDGKSVRCGDDDLAICDAEGPVALAGVMGGRDSEVDASTTDVALECALFAPLAVREASKRHQIRSDSSFRFERFVDPGGLVAASDRAAQLLVEVCGARSVGALCVAGDIPAAAGPSIPLRLPQVQRVFGVPVERAESDGILTSLGCELVEDGADSQVWRVPSWRPDLVEEIDLIEEIARRAGFERVPDDVRIPVRPLPVDPRAEALARVRRAFLDCALQECLTEPFVGTGPEDVAMERDAPALEVQNPMRAEESRLRRSLIGTLLRVARGNGHRGNRGLRLFEIAPVYIRGDGTPAAGDTDTFELLLGAASVNGTYADAKGIAEVVLAAVGWAGRVRFEKGAPPPFTGCRGARILHGETRVGHVVELDAKARDLFGLMEATSIVELDVGCLLDGARTEAVCRPVSRHPAVERDLDLVVDESVTWSSLASCVEDGAGELLESVEPFDVFRGDRVGRGKKSITLRMWLRSDERTLTAAEADERVARILSLVGERTGGVLRS